MKRTVSVLVILAGLGVTALAKEPSPTAAPEVQAE